MGAGASAAGEAAEVIRESSERERIVAEGADALHSATEKVDAAGEETLEVAVVAGSGVATLVASIPEDQREAAGNMFNSCQDMLSTDQLNQAVDSITGSLEGIEGDAILVEVGGALQAVSEMAPEIMAAVGASLLAVGEHLPYIGVACGAIGAIAYTFRLSKDQDENVKTVQIWTASVKDWLLLVAVRIQKSGAESTIPLFEALQEALLKMSEQMYQRNRKWRISKMLTSTAFQRDFTRAKESVLELKNALRDYLDQEMQDKQEEYLGSIQECQIQTNEKLDSMQEQLSQIQSMLQVEAEKRAAEANSDVQVKDQEEQIYSSMQQAAGVEGDVPFKRFVYVFESFFYGGDDMPPEQKRGLRILLDKDADHMVSKPIWIKFYRQWTSSNLNIEEYLNKIAEENPTMYAIGIDYGTKAKEKALEQMELAKKGAENIDKEALQQAAVEKGTELAGKAAGFASNMGKMGKGMLKKKIKG